jgi:hypothetical protein
MKYFHFDKEEMIGRNPYPRYFVRLSMEFLARKYFLRQNKEERK